MKLFNLKAVQTQIFFRNLLLLVGLFTFFASMIQQGFDLENEYSTGSSQANIVQLDKDNQRDAADKAVIAELQYHQPSEINAAYFYFSASYQEPTLLVQQRPPNA